MKQIQIIEAKHHVGETVTIGAWVANKRSSGKIAFLQLRDGTAYFQGIVVKSEVSEDIFQLAKNLNQETSVMITGEIREDTRSKFGYEIGVSDVQVVGESHEYPITPKEHGTDFLMDRSSACSYLNPESDNNLGCCRPLGAPLANKTELRYAVTVRIWRCRGNRGISSAWATSSSYGRLRARARNRNSPAHEHTSI